MKFKSESIIINNKKWHELPEAKSWQFYGIPVLGVILLVVTVFLIYLSYTQFQADFIKHTNWMFILGTLVSWFWYECIRFIQKNWDDVESLTSGIADKRIDRMYTDSYLVYIFCQLSRVFSFFVMLSIAYFLLASIGNDFLVRPFRVFVVLSVLAVFFFFGHHREY